MLRAVQVWMSGVALTALTIGGATAAAAQEPQKPVLTLDGDFVMITVLINPEKAGDFDTVLAKYKEALAKNEKVPARKQQLDGMKFYKSTQQAQGKDIYYILVEPVIKGEEYDISRVIAEVFPVEVQKIFELYKGAFAGRAISSLKKLP